MKIPRKTQTYKTRSPNLITKVFALFFVAVSLISLTNLLVFSRLMNTLEYEATALNNQQVSTAVVKLDGIMTDVQNRYASMIQKEEFQSYVGLEPSAYTLHQMFMEASEIFNSCPYIQTWAVLLQDTPTSINYISVNNQEQYFQQFCVSDTYTPRFWREQFGVRFSRKLYPAAAFTVSDRASQANVFQKELLPLAMKSYWTNNIMVVLFLNIDAICEEVGLYMTEGTYLFSENGELLYTSDGERQITSVPEEKKLNIGTGAVSVFKASSSKNGLQYVKLIAESQAMEMVRSSKSLFLLVTLLALGTASVLILYSVRRTLHPINGMLDLLQQHTGETTTGDIRQARTVLEEVLQQREEQARTLAKQDALLSEYALRAQLKSLYVSTGQANSPDEGQVFILHIQVHYKESAIRCIQTPRAQLENLLQEVLSAELSRQFMSSLIFQLEPGCFAAKVTLAKNSSMVDRMTRFLQRLEQEREFACFTVVQSRSLSPGEDLAEVYAAVLQAARQARICDQTQWLSTDALPPEKEILFSRQEEQRLAASIHARQPETAAEQAFEILQNNLHRGITYAQMEILCVALVNTATYAMSELMPSTERIAAVSGVYNLLITRCKTADDYCDTVTRFIRGCTEGEGDAQERDTLLKKVQLYLQNNYQREFSGEEMAEDLKVSRSYLSSYYKNKTGMNLSDSIQLYRIRKAMELMKDPDIKISEVGAMVGISSGNTFLRQFKKYTGMSPKEYRAKSRE